MLIRPSANRVYSAAAPALMRAELHVLLEGALGNVTEAMLGGVRYLMASCDEPLDEAQIAFLSNASCLYALYEVRGDLLSPIDLSVWDRYDDDLVSIQRYMGKTNELFTKLLLNVTLASSPRSLARFTAGETVKVLDPLCGRGTSLNQALMYGMDASGLEIDKKDFEAYSVFIRTWLKDKRLKHRAKPSPARRLTIPFHSKESAREQVVDVVNDDTVNGGAHFPKSGFDLIITDLPYGIQHGSRSDLLVTALPVWRSLLKGGGAIGLSWNTRIMDRPVVETALAAAGLEPRDLAPARFEHRVDRTITRDLIVATKPS
jgi:SAM-dependent methyltransferase